MSDPEKKHEQSITLLIAVIGVLGAIGSSMAGAFETGNFALRAQRLQLEQARLQLSGVNAKAELDTLRQIAADYYFQLLVVCEPIGGRRVEDLGLDFTQEFVSFQKAGSKLLLYSEPDFGYATSRLNIAVSEALRATGTSEIAAKQEALDQEVRNWVIAYHQQASRYRGQALPDDSSNLRRLAESLSLALGETSK